jgi:hypothetical protein
VQDEEGHNDGSDGIGKPEFRYGNDSHDGDNYGNGTEGIAPVVPSIGF